MGIEITEKQKKQESKKTPAYRIVPMELKGNVD